MVSAADPGLADVLAEVRRIELQTRRLVSSTLAGGYLSVFRGAGMEFESVREYVPGDDPRAVDWNVTARMGRPYVKTFANERDLQVLFLLDTSASMEGGYGPWSARQVAARVCACLGFSAVRGGDRVGLLTFGAGVEAYVPPRRGSAHVLRIVRDCLMTPSAGETSALAPALDLAARALRRHAIVFILSDFLHDGWQKSLRHCARRHDVIAVRLLTPELTRPAAGLTRVRDPESGRTQVLDWSRPRVRAAYAERVADWERHTERELRRAQVDRMDVRLPREGELAPIAGPILRFFRMREQRGAKR